MFGPGVRPALAAAMTARGYAQLTPVQAAVAQAATTARDLLVSAKTGSGKTVAYGLAMASELIDEAEVLAPAGAPLALVIAPTRELALQVQRELEWLYASAGAKVVACVGGMDARREARVLAQGCHIVVGTPGRLRDHIERGQLDTGRIAVAVLDEADEMLDLGFREELEEILDTTPPARRTLLFSATLPKPIVALAQRYQKDALRLAVDAGEEKHGDIEYRAVRIAPNEVAAAAVNLLRFYEAGAALVFCSTREAVRRLHADLVERGFAVVALSGELTQNERTTALQALRDRRVRVCVATDVAARGIDIPDLELVIHADLPNDAETLQHRSGRTGRAGRKGICAILVPHPRRRRAEMMLRAARVQVEWVTAPRAEEIRERDVTRLLGEIAPATDAPEDDATLARTLLEQKSAEEVALALVRLNRARLPAPEDLAEVGPERAPGAASGPSAYAGGGQPGARPGFEDTLWFRIDIGRNKNADPRWLLPMICRRGHITKRDIGAIRVFERETRFEIVRAVEARFREAIAQAADDDATIVAEDEATPLPPRDRPKPYKGPKPSAPPNRDPQAASPWASKNGESKNGELKKARPSNADGPKPYGAKPAGDRPAYGAKPGGKAPYGKPSFDKPGGKPAYGAKKPYAGKSKAPRKPAEG